jgi:aspartokinase
MRTISQHVRAVIEETPFLGEVMAEGLGNCAAIARAIQKDVEKRVMEKVSLQAVAMALHRLPQKEKSARFGFKYLRDINDITLRSDLTLIFIHGSSSVFERLATFEKKHPESVHGVTKGLAETLIIARREEGKALEMIFNKTVSRIQERVTAITMRLPDASMAVPGVYYPILKALAWKGINVVEVVSAVTELTLFVEDQNVERSLQTIRTLIRSN